MYIISMTHDHSNTANCLILNCLILCTMKILHVKNHIQGEVTPEHMLHYLCTIRTITSGLKQNWPFYTTLILCSLAYSIHKPGYCNQKNWKKSWRKSQLQKSWEKNAVVVAIEVFNTTEIYIYRQFWRVRPQQLLNISEIKMQFLIF